MFDDRYRQVPERRVLGILLLSGWAFEIEAGHSAEALATTIVALDSWIAIGLPYRLSDHGVRLFDPVEVVNFAKWAGLQGLDGFWIDRFVATGRALVQDLSGSVSNGVSSREPARFKASLERTFDLAEFKRGARVRLRLPLPIPGPFHPMVEIIDSGSSAPHAEIIRGEGRLDVRLEIGSERMVKIGAEISFTAAQHCPIANDCRLEPEEKELYLRPIEGLIRVTPGVHALAHALGGTTGGASWAVAHAFWDHLIEKLCLGRIHYDQVPVDAPGDWVLESGWYDCQLGSALLVSLCRARGIPARIISGNVLYRLAPTNHFWAEAWIEDRGWIPFDLLSWDLSVGGRDPAWRDYFAGSLDHRLVSQCLPLSFTGPMSVRFPSAWHMIQARKGSGIEIRMTHLDGTLIYSDEIVVQPDQTCLKKAGPV